MSFVSQFLMAPLILQIFGTACVLSSPARSKHCPIHTLTPLTISLCLWACSSLLARGADKCGPGPGADYTLTLAIGAMTIALVVALISYSRSARAIRIVESIAIAAAMASVIACLHQFGHYPRFMFNPFYCATSYRDPHRPLLTALEFIIPMLTISRDLKSIRDVMGRLSGWYGKRHGP